MARTRAPVVIRDCGQLDEFQMPTSANDLSESANRAQKLTAEAALQKKMEQEMRDQEQVGERNLQKGKKQAISNAPKKARLRENEPVESETTSIEESQAAIANALQAGGKDWGRSKILIVGEGRAGKTALANSIIGKPFEETESTVGISQLVCDVSYARGGGGQASSTWSAYTKPEREMEAAIAFLVAAEKNKLTEAVHSNSRLSDSSSKTEGPINMIEAIKTHFPRYTAYRHQEFYYQRGPCSRRRDRSRHYCNETFGSNLRCDGGN